MIIKNKYTIVCKDASAKQRVFDKLPYELSKIERRDWNLTLITVSLTDDERDILIADSDIMSIDPKIEWDDSFNDVETQILDINRGGFTDWFIDNWGLYRHSMPDNDFNLSNINEYRENLPYNYNYDGTGIDVVLQEGGLISYNDVEFEDDFGNTRFVKYQWNRHFPDGAGGYLFDDINYDFAMAFSHHASAVASFAVGRTLGWAKNANIYLIPTMFVDSEFWWDAIRLFHEAKVSGGNTTPTVVNASWGRKVQAGMMMSTYFRGKHVNKTIIMDKRNPPNRKYGICGTKSAAGTSKFNIAYPSDLVETKELTDSGVHYVKSAGNQHQKLDIPGGLDYNNYVTSHNEGAYLGVVDDDLPFFYNRGAGNISHDTIVVGALHDDLNLNGDELLAYYSEKGPRVDCCVAGSNLYGLAAPPYNRVHMSGTSFSTPQVAGMLAMVLQKYPNTTPAQARKYFRDIAIGNDSLWDDYHNPLENQDYMHGDPEYFGEDRTNILMGYSGNITYLDEDLTFDPSTITNLIPSTVPDPNPPHTPSPTNKPDETGIEIYSPTVVATTTAFRKYKVVGYDDEARTQVSDGSIHFMKMLDSSSLDLLSGAFILSKDEFDNQPKIGWLYATDRGITIGCDFNRYKNVNVGYYHFASGPFNTAEFYLLLSFLPRPREDAWECSSFFESDINQYYNYNSEYKKWVGDGDSEGYGYYFKKLSDRWMLQYQASSIGPIITYYQDVDNISTTDDLSQIAWEKVTGSGSGNIDSLKLGGCEFTIDFGRPVILGNTIMQNNQFCTNFHAQYINVYGIE